VKYIHSIIAILAVAAVVSEAREASAQATIPPPKINEVNAGEGGLAPRYGPFIELYNDQQAPMDLSLWTLENNDGSATVALSNVQLAAGDFYVICGTTGEPVPDCDQMDANLPTIAADTTIGFVSSVSVTFDGGVLGNAPDPVTRSALTTGRYPDGAIRETNTFRLMCPTPGTANEQPGGLTCGVVINEVDYDQGETDNARFVELAVYDERSLACAELRFADPNDAETTFIFPEEMDVSMPGDFIVICDDKDVTANCDYEFTETELGCGTSDDIAFSDTGKHGIALYAQIRVPPYDSLSYNGLVDGYTEGGVEAVSDIASPGPISINRVPDYADTQVNGDDFVVACATPGAENATDLSSCDLCGTLVVEGDEECDEGGEENTATCEVDCTLPACGDGIFNAAAGEECDPTDPDPDAPACTDDCILAGAFARGSGGCGTGCAASKGGSVGGLALMGLVLLVLVRRRRRY
jgi:MYXO-CTERM domain-containing protein